MYSFLYALNPCHLNLNFGYFHAGLQQAEQPLIHNTQPLQQEKKQKEKKPMEGLACNSPPPIY